MNGENTSGRYSPFVRDATIVVIAEGIAGLTGFFYMAFSARMLGVDAFGLFQGAMGWFATVMVIGTPLNLVVMHVVSSSTASTRRRTSAWCLRWGSIVSMVAGLATAGFAWPLAVYLHSGVLPMLAVAGMVMARIMTLALYGGMQGRNMYVRYATARVTEAAFCLMTGAGLLMAGAGVTGILCGYAAGMAAVLAGWFRVHGEDDGRDLAGWPVDRKTVRDGLRLAGALAFAAVIGDLPMLVVRGAMRGDDPGMYGALYTLRHLLLPFCAAVWYPFYTHAIGGMGTRSGMLGRAVVAVAGIGAVFLGVSVAAPGTILQTIFGAQYVGAQTYIAAFAGVLLLQVLAMTVLLGSVVMGSSFTFAGLASCLVMALVLFLAKNAGISGILIAQAGAWAVLLAVQVPLLLRRSGRNGTSLSGQGDVDA